MPPNKKIPTISWARWMVWIFERKQMGEVYE